MLRIMKEKTMRKRIITCKPIYYHWESLHALFKARGGLNMPTTLLIQKYYLNIKLLYHSQSNLQLKKKSKLKDLNATELNYLHLLYSMVHV